MSAPSTVHTDVYFYQRDGSACDRSTKPSFGANQLLGEVDSCEFMNDQGEEVFQKWNSASGRHEDHTVFPVQDVLTGTIVVKEITATFFNLLRRASAVISGGGASYVPFNKASSTINFPGEGWMKFEHKDQRGLTLDVFYIYGYLSVPRHSFARGVQNITFNFRSLYASDANRTSTWSNIP